MNHFVGHRAAWTIAAVVWIGATPTCLRAQSQVGASAVDSSAYTPVAAVERFFDAIGALRWSSLAASLHPETLDLFRMYVTSVADNDDTGDFAARVLGTRDGVQVRALGAERLFAELVGAIYRNTPALIEVLATNAYAFLGHVSEGDTLAHVVARVTPYTSGSAPTKLTTVTVKRAERGWLVLESPELDALSTAMRGLTFRPGDRVDAPFD